MNKTILTAIHAREAIIAEFGTLARLFNPASKAYAGYKFSRKLILFGGKVFKAFVASNYEKDTMAIVSIDRTVIDIVDFHEVCVREDSPIGAKEIFQFFFPTLWALFNPADDAHSVDAFAETETGYCAVDSNRQHQFMVPIGEAPYICDPAS